jgi:hypothetical protein
MTSAIDLAARSPPSRRSGVSEREKRINDKRTDYQPLTIPSLGIILEPNHR